ncbi:Cyanovirin-N [Naviculisporaceae sp. PSN 640]
MRFSSTISPAILMYAAGAVLALHPVVLDADSAADADITAPSTTESDMIMGSVVPEAEVHALTALYPALAVAESSNPTAQQDEEVGKLGKRSYMSSCTACILRNDNPRLFCACPNKAGKGIISNIDLNTCIGNRNGTLIWQRDGNFKRTCFTAFLANGHELFANCRTSGNSTDTRIDLNEKIHNIDGVITYKP